LREAGWVLVAASNTVIDAAAFVAVAVLALLLLLLLPKVKLEPVIIAFFPTAPLALYIFCCSTTCHRVCPKEQGTFCGWHR